jgi:hypothetical protein
VTAVGWRGPLMALALSLMFFAASQTGSPRPDIGALKKGVVRIRNTRFGDVGAGIIIKLNRDEAYIVTASHVVRGDANPEVYMFTRQNEPLRATLVHREDDDQKGLALLWLKADRQALTGLMALGIGSSAGLEGGEEVRLVGFPDGTAIWTVTPGAVARLEGREVVLAGPVPSGNSGGPVLLGNQVIGLVTDSGATLAYAVQAESIALYVRGVKPELADLAAMPTPTPTTRSTPKSTLTPPKKSPEVSSAAYDFCATLAMLLVASENGFHSIKGMRESDSSELYYPTIYLPGSASGRGWVIPDKRTYYFVAVDKDKELVEAEYAKVVSQVSGCLPTWEHKEEHFGDFRYHKFRESKKGKLVTVDYNEKPQNEGMYYLSVTVYPRNNDWW